MAADGLHELGREEGGDRVLDELQLLPEGRQEIGSRGREVQRDLAFLGHHTVPPGVWKVKGAGWGHRICTLVLSLGGNI